MRKLMKVLGYLVAGLVAVIAVAAVAIYFGSNAKLKKTYVVNVQPVSMPDAGDAAALARGKHLAVTRGCTECHAADLGGAKVIENGAMGAVHGPNLTRGQGGVPANWTDLDYVRAIRHGVAQDGRGLFLMPSTDYARFSDTDMGALIAYIKSMPPVNRPRGPVALGPVARGLTAAGKIKLAAEEIDHANVKPAVVTPGVTVEYGRYVAASCSGCHGANFSGGKIEVGPPDWPAAANLTPHADGRLAKWSEADFLKAVRTQKRPDGSAINPVMPAAFGAMDDVELKAIWVFFKTLPATATGVR
jgi:cytochrome c553